jgi:hypothetical protein
MACNINSSSNSAQHHMAEYPLLDMTDDGGNKTMQQLRDELRESERKCSEYEQLARRHREQAFALRNIIRARETLDKDECTSSSSSPPVPLLPQPEALTPASAPPALSGNTTYANVAAAPTYLNRRIMFPAFAISSAYQHHMQQQEFLHPSRIPPEPIERPPQQQQRHQQPAPYHHHHHHHSQHQRNPRNGRHPIRVHIESHPHHSAARVVAPVGDATK